MIHSERIIIMKRLTLTLEQLAKSNEQDINKGNSVVHDPDFPVFPTPIDKKVLVYIPKTTELFTSVVHEVKSGNTFAKVRCVHGLDEEFAQFGYTGECPFCQKLQTVWDNFDMKMNLKAREVGVDRDNDPDGLLKGTKTKLLREMPIKNAQKYVVVPVVVIGEGSDGKLYDEGKPYFVFWTWDRWVKKVQSELEDEGALGQSVFMRWSFTYDTKGKQATAMESAKALTTKVISPSEIMKSRQKEYEELLKDFTTLKAVDNIKALNFYEYKDIEAQANKLVERVERENEQYRAGQIINTNAIGTIDTVAAIEDFNKSKS